MGKEWLGSFVKTGTFKSIGGTQEEKRAGKKKSRGGEILRKEK